MENHPVFNDNVMENILGYLVHNGVSESWTKLRHYGHCGQSCGCCRGHNTEDSAPVEMWYGLNCELCINGWVWTTVSKGMRDVLQGLLAVVRLICMLGVAECCKLWNGGCCFSLALTTYKASFDKSAWTPRLLAAP